MKQLAVAQRCQAWGFIWAFVVSIIASAEMAPAQGGPQQPVVTKDGFGIRKVCVDPADEVWLVSARDFRCQGDQSQLKTSQLIDGRWEPSSIERVVAAHAADKTRATIAFVHGYRTDQTYAESRGLQVYDNLFGTRCGKRRPPVRWVIFAWRSECEHLRVVPDFKAKCARAFDLKLVFADFLDRFSDRNMIVAGFSLGSQVVLGGLSEATVRYVPKPGHFRVALVAPALSPEYRRDDLPQFPFLSGISQTAVFVNRGDRAVQLARRILNSDSEESATSLRQLSAQSGCQVPNPIRLFDMTEEVSKRHSINVYTSESASLQCELLTMVRTLHDLQVAADDSGEIQDGGPRSGAAVGKRQAFGLQNETAGLR